MPGRISSDARAACSRRLSAIGLVLVLGAASTAQADSISAGAAPGCTLHLGAAQARELRQYRGKVVYLDFWASWCTSCVLSFPYMNQLTRDFGAQGLEVVGVDMDEHPEDAQRFLARHPATFDIASGANAACAKAFGVKAMPSSFLIDRRGVIRERREGFQPGEANRLRSGIQTLLAEPAPAT